jgi:hypothetical protein
MVVFVHRRPSCPERPMLTDDVLADLELAWETEILDVAMRLGRVQAEQGVVPLPSLVGALREVFDGDQPSVRSRELPDDPTVDDLVGHRSKKSRSSVAQGPLSRTRRACVRGRASARMDRGYDGGRPEPSGVALGAGRANHALRGILFSDWRVPFPASLVLRHPLGPSPGLHRVGTIGRWVLRVTRGGDPMIWTILALACIVLGFVGELIDERILLGTLEWFVAAIAFNTLGSLPFVKKR